MAEVFELDSNYSTKNFKGRQGPWKNWLMPNYNLGYFTFIFLHCFNTFFSSSYFVFLLMGKGNNLVKLLHIKI